MQGDGVSVSPPSQTGGPSGLGFARFAQAAFRNDSSDQSGTKRVDAS